MRDPETGNSRGFGFISYDSFEASDAAIEAMNDQYLCNRQITVSYAYKKDTKGERHGTPAERVLAASNPTGQKSRPHTLFASGPPMLPSQHNGTASALVPPHGLSQMAVFLHPRSQHSVHHLHRLVFTPPCRCPDHHPGRVNHHNLVKLAWFRQCRSSGACRRRHLHKLHLV
ncbi:splicing factor 3B subunit 4-like [Olea europaea var. sylvestris]|uniref:splicing factor 3B subunit 4-like n=1 Tax=Olea europaea var. sylvestris TaxID=158386 RepID=UPI000C1D70A2|nr:splicing factor 3B subunit 4-like [Olea europaea var. sylvestris]